MPKFDSEVCDCCGGCSAVCPENAVTVFFKGIKVDSKLCTECLVCKKICPVNAIHKKTN